MAAISLADLPAPPDGKTGWPWTESSRVVAGRDWPRITVVTPSYQQGDYLEETIRSVLLQNYPNLEYIVIDGGSRDNSLSIIDRYRDHLAYSVSEPDRGQAHAINKGFQRATGEILGWLNSDDLLEPNALFRIAAAFRRPDVHIVTGFRKVIDRESRVTAAWIRDLPTPRYLRHYCCVAQETTYWRHDLTRELGLLDESFQFALDYEYWLRMIRAGYRFHAIPAYLGRYRDYSDNKTNALRAVYLTDVTRLYEMYNLGSSEAEVLADLGALWFIKFRFLEEWTSPSLTRFPRLVMLLLRSLETRPFLDLFCAFYDTYRRRRPLEGESRAPSPRLAAAFEVLARMPARLTSMALRDFSNRRLKRTLRPIEDFSVDVAPAPAPPRAPDPTALWAFNPDRLVLGQAWSAIRVDGRESCRWAGQDAEILIRGSTSALRYLSLDIAPRADVRDGFHLWLLDDADQLVSEVFVRRRQIAQFRLPIRPGGECRYRLRFHRTGDELALTENQPGLYCAYRAGLTEWAIPLIGHGHTIARRHRDSLPTSVAHIPEVNGFPPDLPVDSPDAVCFGQRWYPLERYEHDVFRWADNDAEIYVRSAQTKRRVLYLWVAPGIGPGRLPFDVWLLNDAGEVEQIATIATHQILAFTLHLRANEWTRYRFHVEGSTHRSRTDRRLLNFRVFRMGFEQQGFEHEIAYEFLDSAGRASLAFARLPRFEINVDKSVFASLERMNQRLRHLEG